MVEQSTTNTRAISPDESRGEVPQGVDLWRIPIYVPDGDVLALLAPAAGVRSESSYLVNGTAGAVRIDADEHGRLSVDDGNGSRRPVVLAEARRMVTRTDLKAGHVSAATVIASVDASVNVDHLDAPDEDDDEPTEAECRSCEFVVALDVECVVCGDANPHAPEPDTEAPTLFTAPRLPEFV